MPDRSRSYIFGVDLDGVCGDYTGAFRAVVAKERGVDPAELSDDVSWNFGEWGIATDDEFEELHRLAVLDHHIFRTMAAIDGVADVLWRLSDAGVWIRIITHRLAINWGHATVVADTVAWLDDSRIPYRDLCFLGAKPEVEADTYVDDAPHNIASLRASGNHAIVFSQPHNRSVEGPRADSWDEVETLVVAHMTSIGFGHQAPLPGIHADPDRLDRRLARP